MENINKINYNCDYDFTIEETKDGRQIVRIKKIEKKVYIGSKYNMTSEIDKLVRNIESKNNSIYIIFGLGTGEYIEYIREKSKESIILIIEPNKKIIEYYLKRNPLMANYRNIKILHIDNDIRSKVKQYITEVNVKDIKYVTFANYNKIYEKEYSDFTKILNEILFRIAIGINTRFKFSDIWYNNFLDNLSYMIKGTPVTSYINTYKNVPAIIVSAGPSLDKNIKDLKLIDNNMLIVTGARTLKSLMENNTPPDVIAMLDPIDLNYEFIKDYSNKYTNPMLIYENTNAKAVKVHRGEKIFFSQNRIVEEIFGQKNLNLIAGGTVSHVAITFASIMGCNPIILIGQDLAYTDNKVYSDSANSDICTTNKHGNIIHVKDINGNNITTSREFNSFRIEIEENIIKSFPHITYIDATEGGVKIEGTKIMTLEDVIEKYKDSPKVKFESKQYDNNSTKERSIELLSNTEKAIKIITKKSAELLELNKKMKNAYLNNSPKIDVILNRMNKLDSSLEKQCKNIDLLSSLFYNTIFKIMDESQYKEDDNIEKLDKVNKIYERGELLYKSIINICNFAKPKIVETRNRIMNSEDFLERKEK